MIFTEVVGISIDSSKSKHLNYSLHFHYTAVLLNQETISLGNHQSRYGPKEGQSTGYL